LRLQYAAPNPEALPEIKPLVRLVVDDAVMRVMTGTRQRTTAIGMALAIALAVSGGVQGQPTAISSAAAHAPLTPTERAQVYAALRRPEAPVQTPLADLDDDALIRLAT
jgi:hypothetical protein